LTANVSTNGVLFNDNVFNITIAQPLLHDTAVGTTADGGLTKSGAGVTTLSGVSTYSGLTTVNGGTLLVTGVLGTNAVTVNTNATLSGTGTLNGATTVALGGTVKAGLGGNDTSTLVISNSLTLGGNAVFNLNRTNAQPANKVAGLSAVNFGGTLTVTNVGDALQAADTFTLFQAGSYTGSFTTLILPTLGAGLSWNTSQLAVNGTIFVAGLPAVTTTPTSTNFIYGNSAVLTASASGATPLFYQWYDNSTNGIAGETNSTLTLTAPGVSASGNYTVIVTNAYGSATNLVAVTVTPAPLGVTANDTNRFYGAANPAFTATYTGFVNGDTVAVVGGSPSLTTAATSTSPVGACAISAAIGSLTAANYSFVNFTNGTLTVNPLAVVLTGSRAYDGTTNVVAAILSVANFVGSDDVNLASGTGGLAGAGVGTQAITSFGTFALGGTTAGNYTLTGASASVVITNATSSVALLSSQNPSGFRESVAFTANVTPSAATGSIQFLTNGVLFDTQTLSGGSATSLSLTNLPRGANPIIAIYSGDGNYSPSTNSLSQVVTNHAPTAALMTVGRPAGYSLKIALSDLATNWADVDGDTVTLAGLNSPTTNNVNLSISSGFIFYTNGPDVNDQFSYSITDGQGSTNTGIVNIVIIGNSTNTTPNILAQTVNLDGSVTINIAGIPGFTYSVQATTNLTVSWQTIGSGTAGTNGLWQFTDTNAINFLTRYYRTAYP
jgi:autotransporter-associated beta strand protein